MYKIGMGILVLGLVVILGTTLKVSGQAAEDAMCVPMGQILIEPPEGVEAKKSPVPFPHARHFITGCRECHHKWTGEEKIQNCSTSECHDLIEPPQKPKKYLSYSDVAIKYYKYAYHQMCIGCHKEIKMANKAIEMSYKVVKDTLPAAGPSSCKECHPEEE
jgi:hypothetical protein